MLCLQFQIRALESQKRQQEIVLRRKTQEVSGDLLPHKKGKCLVSSKNTLALAFAVLEASHCHPERLVDIFGGCAFTCHKHSLRLET